MLTREEFLRRLGEALRAAREKRGLSREELAERLSQNPVDPEDYLRRLAALCTLAQTIREQKGLTHKQVAERAKLSVRFVRDLEACKIQDPDAYNIYCLSFGLGVPYPKFEARIARLSHTPLDDHDGPISAKRKTR